MKITVKLHTTLKKFAPEESRGVVELELPDGARAQDAIVALKIPENFVGAVFIAGQRVEASADLEEGIEVNLIAPIGGG